MMLDYRELRQRAAREMRRDLPDHTLQPTAAPVNEANLRLTKRSAIDWRSRAPFYAVASTEMRRTLADHARHRAAAKRGGARHTVALESSPSGYICATAAILDLDAALNELAQFAHRQARVVELTVFGGLTETEAGEVLGVSARTVRRDRIAARAWLHSHLDGDGL